MRGGEQRDGSALTPGGRGMRRGERREGPSPTSGGGARRSPRGLPKRAVEVEEGEGIAALDAEATEENNDWGVGVARREGGAFPSAGPEQGGSWTAQLLVRATQITPNRFGSDCQAMMAVGLFSMSSPHQPVEMKQSFPFSGSVPGGATPPVIH